jgi:hypothetical protein
MFISHCHTNAIPFGMDEEDRELVLGVNIRRLIGLEGAQ